MRRKFNYSRLYYLNNRHDTTDSVQEIEFDLQKSLDELCYQTELAECTWDYAFRFCQGIKKIFSKGIDPKKLQEHKLFTLKLLNLGEDLLECSPAHSDLYFLGGFIELKVIDEWKNASFYEFIIEVLKHIKKKVGFFSEQIKQKIVVRIQSYNPKVYRMYFHVYSNSS